MQLTITPEVEALIHRGMESGHFKNANDLIEAALHSLLDGIPYTRSELDAMIQEGIDSADRGELYTEGEARAYIAEMRAKL